MQTQYRTPRNGHALAPPPEKTALKTFVLEQMRTLNTQVLAFIKEGGEHFNKTGGLLHWNPDTNMTVAKVNKAFNAFCLDPKNSLQSAFETSQHPAATATAIDGAVTAPTTVNIVLKESKNNHLLVKSWVYLFRKTLPDDATKQALSSEVTLSQYSTLESQDAGWKTVANAESIRDSGFQEERLRLARVLVVAEVMQKLKESTNADVEGCVKQVINDRLPQSSSGNTTAKAANTFSTKLRKSTTSIANTVKNIQGFLKHDNSAPTMLLQVASELPQMLHGNSQIPRKKT